MFASPIQPEFDRRWHDEPAKTPPYVPLAAIAADEAECCVMPEISRFFGIVIYMNWRDHPPAATTT